MQSTIITVAQQKGGSGKTTVAINLAVCFAKQGKKVSIIDIDPQASLTSWYNIRKNNFGQENTLLNFYATSGWRIDSEINRIKDNNDIIIIDSQPHTETDTKTAIRASDLVIVPVQPSPADLWATMNIIKLIEREGKKIAILLNRVSNKSRLIKSIILDIPNLLESTLGNRVVFASCLLEGKSVNEIEQNSLASQEIEAICAELEKKYINVFQDA